MKQKNANSNMKVYESINYTNKGKYTDKYRTL